MWTGISRTVTAESELVTVSDVKSQLRLTTSEFDTMLTSLVVTAREYIENMTGRIISASTFAAYYDEWETMFYLPNNPITAFTSLQYLDYNGDTQTMDSTDYSVDIISEPSRVFMINTYTLDDDAVNRIIFNYTAGYTSVTIPSGLKQAVISAACSLFENPEENTEASLNDNKQIKRLIDLYTIRTVY